MSILITIPFILIVTYIFTRIGKLIKIPIVVSLIISGLFIGIPFLKNIVVGQNIDLIFNLGDLALICLMFLAGLETQSNNLKKEFKDAALIAVFAALTPFLLGFVIFHLLLGFSLTESFVVGLCMSITAEATKARVLLDLKKLRTRIGTLMMEAGIMDDILGLGIFIIFTFLLKDFYLKENILLTAAIFAFFLGILVKKKFGKHNKFIRIFEKLLMLGIIPFFFVSMGLHFEYTSLAINPLVVFVTLIVAFTGKLFGTFMVKPFSKLKWKQLYLIGWAMNSRGALELALALISFRSNLISIEIYSSLVVMALVTTISFPFVLTRMIRNNPKIMN